MISIIVPVYNTAPYLPQCLDSLVNQTYRDIEIICVNDGSTDNSPDILKAYAERDSRILVIHQENLGLSGARNKGLESARGEWVMFVDSDDWIGTDCCKTLLSHTTNKRMSVFSLTFVNLPTSPFLNICSATKRWFIKDLQSTGSMRDL